MVVNIINGKIYDSSKCKIILEREYPSNSRRGYKGKTWKGRIIQAEDNQYFIQLIDTGFYGAGANDDFFLQPITQEKVDSFLYGDNEFC